MKDHKAYLKIVNTIIQQIADGSMNYDEKFYTEQEATAIFHVSRPTLREALRVLEFLGITTVKPHRGIYIHHPEEHGSYPVLRYILAFEQPSAQEISELYTALQQISPGNRPASKLSETIFPFLPSERSFHND